MAHLAIARPGGGVQQGALAAPPGGAGTLAPLRLDSRSTEGEYTVTARLVGEGGAMSEPATASVRLAARGAAAPRVDGTRWRGAEGDLVVRGAGFDGPALAVLLDGAPAPVAEVADGELLVHAAGLVNPASLEVRTALGSGHGRGEVRPRATLAIMPDDPAVAEGEAVRLQAARPRVARRRRGLVGRRRPPGVTIDDDGTLHVGHDAPEAVVVRAESAADPRVSAEATVRVVRPARGHGRAWARAAAPWRRGTAARP